MTASALPSIDEPETFEVDAHAETVMCDGSRVVCDGVVIHDSGNPALGHPATYYTFGSSNVVECGYCDRRFIRRAGH